MKLSCFHYIFTFSTSFSLIPMKLEKHLKQQSDLGTVKLSIEHQTYKVVGEWLSSAGMSDLTGQRR